MEDLPRLKARIASLRDLRDLMRALRALAASHVQEAQDALRGIRRYTGIVEEAIVETTAALPVERADRGAPPPAGAPMLAVFCSEHGFAGAFNERLLDRAERELANGRRLGIVGRRGAVLAEERGLAPLWQLPMAAHVGGIAATARQVVGQLAPAATVDIVFASYRRGGSFEVEVKRLLPLDPQLFAASPRRSPPLHHLAPGDLLERLAGEYLFAEITRAVMESLASENGARLRAMETADHNIGEKLEKLGRREHALRQEAITTELLDVVTGSEAVLANPE